MLFIKKETGALPDLDTFPATLDPSEFRILYLNQSQIFPDTLELD